jgi:transcriptional regulator GlxA family with amidase domain
MSNRLDEPLDRAAVAKHVGLSTRQLDRLFARHLGKSFAAHYRSLRLESARELLRHSTLTISEIAIVCGFANASHFSRSYKDEFRLSPGDQRR